jgi:ATP-dependent RNA helicase RhlE
MSAGKKKIMKLGEWSEATATAAAVPHPSGLTKKERNALKNKRNRENKQKAKQKKREGQGRTQGEKRKAPESVAVNTVSRPDVGDVRDWKDMGLHPVLLRAVTQRLGYTAPSDVQRQCIPHAMQGKDVMACAMTGTGKTAAFVLPMLHRLLNSSRRKSNQTKLIYGLVLTPTRELAIQIHDFILQAGGGLEPPITSGLVYGKMSEKEILKHFKRNVDFIVACPGRMLHMMDTHAKRCAMKHLAVLVLDEADKMLEMGFLDEVRAILGMVSGDQLGADDEEAEAQAPKKRRQTMLFSATFPSAVNALAGNLLSAPAELHVKSTVPTGVAQHVYLSPDRWNCKRYMFLELFRTLILDESRGKVSHREGEPGSAAPPPSSSSASSSFTPSSTSSSSSVMVSSSDSSLLASNSGVTVLTFVSQRLHAEALAHFLQSHGVDALVLHGELSMQVRTDALKAFKAGSCSVLVTTNVLSRGVDIPKLSHVVNYETPSTAFDYIHRVGRTARADRKGEALMFVGPNELEGLAEIEAYLGYEIERKVLPDFDYGRFMKPGLPKPVERKKQPQPQPREADEEQAEESSDDEVMRFDDDGATVPTKQPAQNTHKHTHHRRKKRKMTESKND